MASRLNVPPLPHLDLSSQAAALTERMRHPLVGRPASRREWLALLWKTLLAPWWLWSDIPAPHLPARDARLPAGGPAGDQVVRGLRGVTLRVWAQRALTIVARGVWLVILIAVIWMAIEVLGGSKLDVGVLRLIAVLVAIPTVVFVLLSRPSRLQVATMMDRSFRLQERMITAVSNIGLDIPAPGQRAGIRYLQVADAANAFAVIRGAKAFRVMPPIRELVLGIIFALAFASLFFLRGGGGPLPPLDQQIVPEFIPAAQRFVNSQQELANPSPMQEVPTVAEIQEVITRSNLARQDLQALADALEDHAFTREAASSINEGTYGEAAQELREIAQNADELSESERASLAADLESAAGQMSDQGQTLAEAAQAASEGLQEGGQPAEDGIEQLGDAVEQTAMNVAPKSDLDEALAQAMEAEAAASQPGQSGQQGENQSQSLFDSPLSQQGSSENGNADSQADAQEAGSGANAQAGLAESSDSQTGGESPGQEGEGTSSQSSGGSVAQAPSEDVTAGGESAYQDPELGVDQPASGEDSAAAAAGSGAGQESGEQSASESGSDVSADVATGSEGEPSEPNVSDQSGAAGEGGGASTDPRQAVSLRRSPEGESIQVAGTAGGASMGSGAGVTIASGETDQGEVGIAGPDSNHVPSEYRSIVEAYFSNQD